MSLWKSKKGFTLVEVMCSLMVFSIIFLETSNVMKQCIILRQYNVEKKKNMILLQQLQRKIIYEDTKGVFEKGNDSVFFINGDLLNPSSMEDLSFAQMACSEEPSRHPYCRIQFSKEQEGDIAVADASREQVMKINVSIHFMAAHKERTADLDFIKGEET